MKIARLIVCLLALVLQLADKSYAQESSSSALKQAVSRIHNQAGDLSDKYIHDSTQKERYEAGTWNRIANDRQREWDDQLDAMRRSLYGRHGWGGSMWSIPEASPEARSIRDRGWHSADNIHTEARLHAIGIEQSALGLESQLAHPSNIANSSHLMPHGTNLYVRNYEITPASEDELTPLELTATPRKMSTPILTHNLRQLKNKNVKQ